ncbi:SMI1/KNR4 family protein [Lysinibacillus sp. 3P01SB]|uniref:SMI1/KNR4 family protein n=1 Tax=Lysinibacillus sp. 3P01SB TaxID=3132284 RepID=UPI0039A6D6D1
MTKIQKIHEKLSLKDLEAFERKHKVKFPALYREFLLECNGGYAEPNIFYVSSEEGESVLNVFYGIGNMYDNLDKKFDFFDELIEIGFIPIADDSAGNQICLGVKNNLAEKIYFWNHEQEADDPKENMYFLAENINDFLHRLYDLEVDTM